MQYDIKIKKLPKSEVELECSLPTEVLEKARSKAIKKLSETISIDGFRKGSVPEKLILEKAGEKVVLEEAAEIALSEHYPKILEQAKIDPIGRPNVSITKMALGNPLEFKVTTAVVPEFELPKYKEIAKEITSKPAPTHTATEKEVGEVLLQIRKNKAHLDWHRAHEGQEPEPGEGQKHNHSDFDKEENLPVLDDEFAKSAGNFKNVEELKEKIKENIVAEKTLKETEKRRAAIIEQLVKKTQIDLPNILVESETDKSVAQLKDDVSRMGGKFEDYLTHIKKDEEKLRDELRAGSENRAKIQLIFNKIAEIEKIEPNREIFENEVKNLKEHYKEANEQNIRVYVSTMLINQEVLKLLEAPE